MQKDPRTASFEDFSDRTPTRTMTIDAGKASMTVGSAEGFSDEQWGLLTTALRNERQALADNLRSHYRIEIMFRGKERSTWKPMFGHLSFWEGAAAAYGGGAQKVYLCPIDLKPLPSSASGGGLFACPHCNRAWKDYQVVGEILGRMSAPHWADLVMSYFCKCNMDADLILREQPVMDIRKATDLEQERDRNGDILEPLRAARHPVCYPLKRIIKDVNAGLDLRSRILAFLRS